MKPHKRRDDNEPGIVKALEAIGAVVCRIDNFGVPDLLVGYRGRTILLEVKNPSKTSKQRTRKGEGVAENASGKMTDTQIKWWRTWLGGEAHVVTTPEQAIAIVRGVELHHGTVIEGRASGVVIRLYGTLVSDLKSVIMTADQADTLAGAIHEQAALARALCRAAVKEAAEEWQIRHG